jgi:hypothetical protein
MMLHWEKSLLEKSRDQIDSARGDAVLSGKLSFSSTATVDSGTGSTQEEGSLHSAEYSRRSRANMISNKSE